MSRAAEISDVLLSLLEDSLEVQELWQQHLEDMENGKYATASDSSVQHTFIQQRYMLPLMERCAAEGFAYVDLALIIPGHPITTSEQRVELYVMLEQMAKEMYHAGV